MRRPFAGRDGLGLALGEGLTVAEGFAGEPDEGVGEAASVGLGLGLVPAVTGELGEGGGAAAAAASGVPTLNALSAVSKNSAEPRRSGHGICMAWLYSIDRWWLLFAAHESAL
ncbi:MAG: hypothetical protein M3072_08335 [Candidatus Dormibacteraeota bacterium]|nr:hypothetical protein [Candidatus Dormibacteraeota bacterium]